MNRFFDQVQNAACISLEPLSAIQEQDASALTVEKWLAKLGLESDHVLADSGLCQPEALGRPCKAELIGGHDK